LAHLLNCESGNPSYLQIRTDGDVKIGNDVWIGTEAMILSGVTIGDGAVIGARAVVSKSIPPYTVAVGNSAIVVKERFNNDCVKKLLKIQWWNWDDDKIKRNIKLLLNSNIDAFIKEHEVK
jgi:acetyltransferase-like isoleucine patch superfamily enzyme